VAKRRAIWSPEALIDIKSIWNYYADTAGAAVADRLVREIGRAVLVLEDFPMAGPRS
jgi:toxin ParE1/3/4